MRLTDRKLREAFAMLSAAEKRAVVYLLRYVPGGDRARLQSSAMRRIRAELKRRARSGRGSRGAVATPDQAKTQRVSCSRGA
jgi:hypothetical protein